MKTIRVAAYVAAQGKITDRIIAYCAGGPYSHSEIVFEDGECFSASPRDGGTRFKKIKFRPEAWHFAVLSVSEEDEAKIRKFCYDHAGRGYDYPGALGFILPRIRQVNRKWFCSEIVLKGLQSIGLFPEEPTRRVSPLKVYELACEHRSCSAVIKWHDPNLE